MSRTDEVAEMEIIGVEIKNFKSVKHIYIPWQHLTVLYGPNGAGKSNIIRALNILFDPQSFLQDLKEVSSDFSAAFYLQLEGFAPEDFFWLKEYLGLILAEASLIPDFVDWTVGPPGRDYSLEARCQQLSDEDLSTLLEDHGRRIVEKLVAKLPQGIRKAWETLLRELFRFKYFRIAVVKGGEEDSAVRGALCLPPLGKNKLLKDAADVCCSEGKAEDQSAPLLDSISERLRNRSPSLEALGAPIPVYEVDEFYGYGADGFWLQPPYLISLRPGEGQEDLAEKLQSAVEERLGVLSRLVEALGCELARGDAPGSFEYGTRKEAGAEAGRASDSVRHYLNEIETRATGFLRDVFEGHSVLFSVESEGQQSTRIDTKVQEPHLSFPISLSDASSALRTWSILSVLRAIKEFRLWTDYFVSEVRGIVGPHSST